MPPWCRGPRSTWPPRWRSSARSAPTSPSGVPPRSRSTPQRFDDVVPEPSSGCRPRRCAAAADQLDPDAAVGLRDRDRPAAAGQRGRARRDHDRGQRGPGRPGHPADGPGRPGRPLRARRAGPAGLQRDHERGAGPGRRRGLDRARLAAAARASRASRTRASSRCATCSGWRRCTRSAAPRRSPCSRYGVPGLCAPVNLVTGPGNIYVVAAKRLLKGRVNIDSEAGPTEIAVLADDTADPVHVAADLISQAEHDPLAAAVLVTDSAELADRVQPSWPSRCRPPSTPTRIAEALAGQQSAVVLVDDVEQGIAWSTRTPPSTWRSRPRTPSGSPAGSSTPARSSSAPGPRCRSVTTAPAAPTCCPPPAAPAIPPG